MSERFRITIILLALGAVALGCYDIASPYRSGKMGAVISAVANGNQVYDEVYQGSIADKAGIKKGDILLLDSLSPGQQFQFHMRRAGQRLDIPILRDGKRLNFTVTQGTSLKIQRPIESGLVDLLLLLVFAATGTLVALRGAPRTEVRVLAVMFIAWAWAMALGRFFEVAPTSALAFVGIAGAGGGVGTEGLLQAVIAYCFLMFVGFFPPQKSRLRSIISRCAMPIAVLLSIASAWSLGALWHANWSVFQFSGDSAYTWIPSLISGIVVPMLVLVATIDGLVHVDREHRIQMRWIAAALAIWAYPAIPRILELLTGNGEFISASVAAQQWSGIQFDLSLLLIAYVILRHRVVDVSIVVSRAAIFAIVSAVVVALVVALEWILGQILSRGVGAENANGFAGQALRLTVAVGVGLSAVPLLRLVERWLNRVFFGKRALAIAALGRFALEADVATDSGWLLSVTLDTILGSIDGRWVAIYLATGAGFDRVRSSRDDVPLHLNENDPVLLRLRRWNDSFEVDLGPHPFSEALLLPLSVRGEILGAIVCGPKAERTHYLAEEVDALALVAQRVATAYVLLQVEWQGLRKVLAPA